MKKENTCQQCNSPFIPRNDSPGIFCSKSCNAKYHNARRPKKIAELTGSCLHCSLPIVKTNKFCNLSCSASHNNKKRQPKQSDDKTCTQCNTLLTGVQKIYCSRQCSGQARKKNRPAEYYKAINRETYRRYIARRKWQTPIGEDIKAIKQFYLNCPDGYEVDHIMPISKGGAHSLENLQYLTKEENRRKSNKIL